jgi:hypothetical protein
MNLHFTINRHKTRLKFEPKMGELTYTFRRYSKMSRCLIPINNENKYYYLILNMDFEENNFDKIITEKKSSFNSTRKREI